MAISPFRDRLLLGSALVSLGPFCWWQSRRVLRQVPRLPERFQPTLEVEGTGPPLKVGFIGDSVMAGVGHQTCDTILPTQLCQNLNDRTGRPLQAQNWARNGACTRSVLRELPQQLPAVDLMVVSLGVNDALSLRAPQEYHRNLCRLVERCPSARWLFVGLPNLQDFPSLPFPLRNFLAWRLDELKAAANQLPPPWRVFKLKNRQTLDTFCPDLFHPGPLACRIWAQQLMPLTLEALQP